MISVIIAKKSELVGGRVKKYAPLLQNKEIEGDAPRESKAHLERPVKDVWERAFYAENAALLSESMLDYVKDASCDRVREERLAGYALLSKSMLNYVKDASCDRVREERLAGYALLSSAIRELYRLGLVKVKVKNAEKTPNLRHFPGLSDVSADIAPDFRSDCGPNAEGGIEVGTIDPSECVTHDPDLAETSDIFGIIRGEHGKPEFKHIDLHFNISHSGDIVAVMISDEFEVGVDVECGITPEKEKHLGKRFFTEPLKTQPLDHTQFYYYSVSGDRTELTLINPTVCEPNCTTAARDTTALIVNSDSSRSKVAPLDCTSQPLETHEKITPLHNCSETSKRLELTCFKISSADPKAQSYAERWSIGEAVMKCDGRGFAAYPEICTLTDHARTKTLAFTLDGVTYTITAAVRENK